MAAIAVVTVLASGVFGPNTTQTPNYVDALWVDGFRNVDGAETTAAVARALNESVPAGFAMVARMPDGDDATARFVLDGSVEAFGEDQMRVTARLRDRANGRVLFRRVFERPAEAVRADVVRRLVIALEVALDDGEQASLEGTDDLEAWLLAGAAFEAFRAMTPEELGRAKRFYHDALERDPNFLNARIGLAWAHAVDLFFGWSPDAEATAEALAIADADNASTHALRGLLALREGEHETAAEATRLATRRFPTSADLAAVRGFVLTQNGDAEAGLRFIERAIAAQPAPADWIFWAKARALRRLGRAEAALQALGAARANSLSPVYLAEKAATLMALGRPADARAEVDRLLAIAPDFSARTWVDRFPYRDPQDADAEVVLLKTAGAP